MSIKNLEQWNRSLQKASSGEFARQAGEWLEQSGEDFLDLVREELIHPFRPEQQAKKPFDIFIHVHQASLLRLEPFAQDV